MKKKYLLIITAILLVLGGSLSIVHNKKEQNALSLMEDTLSFNIDNEPNIEVTQKRLGESTYELTAVITPENQSNDIIWSNSHPDLISIETNENKCTITKLTDYRGFAIVAVDVGSKHAGIMVSCTEYIELVDFQFVSTTCSQTSKGYYVKDDESNKELLFDVTFTSNLFKVEKEGYVTTKDYNLYINEQKYDLEYLTTQKSRTLYFPFLFMNRPSFIGYSSDDNYRYDSETYCTTFTYHYYVETTKDYTFTTDYFTINFIEYIDVESLTLDTFTITF